MKPSSKNSLTPLVQLKSDYLELRVRQYRRNGITVSHSYIADNDFGLTVSNFMECEAKVIIMILRKYVYKMRAKYGNNKTV